MLKHNDGRGKANINIKTKQNYASPKYERYRTYLVYYASLILQFLLLPVGFYLLVYQYASIKMSSSSLEDVPHDSIQQLLQSTYELDDIPSQYKSFSNETKLSLGFAIDKHSGKALYKTAKSKWNVNCGKQDGGKDENWDGIWFDIPYALSNPSEKPCFGFDG